MRSFIIISNAPIMQALHSCIIEITYNGVSSTEFNLPMVL